MEARGLVARERVAPDADASPPSALHPPAPDALPEDVLATGLAAPDLLAPAPPMALRDEGQLAYGAAWALQQELLADRAAGRIGDTLLVCEHEPIITVGRGGRGGALLAGATPVVEVERGGQATWHGPGQIVVYPIVALADHARDLRRYLRALEAASIDVALPLGLRAGRREGATGVWIDGARKLVSIGVAARRWITWHGLALNHAPDLSAFSVMDPCGFPASVMTSLAVELGPACPSRAALVTDLARALSTRLRPLRRADGVATGASS